MSAEEKIFGRYTDETGEEYYCPMEPAGKDRAISGLSLDECVEASTVGRYSGWLTLSDRAV